MGNVTAAAESNASSAMLPIDPVVFREIPVIQKIIQDEIWLEGERRGCAVSANDRVVRENVCRVILQIGQQLRDSITTALPNSSAPLTESTTRP